MKNKLLSATVILALSSNVFAMPKKPERCPGAEAIASAGLSDEIIEKDMNGQWLVTVISNQYDTPGTKWSFIVARIDAESREEAFEKAKISLGSLDHKQGPTAIQQISRWGCTYSNAQNYVAIAITPDLAGGMLQSTQHLVK